MPRLGRLAFASALALLVGDSSIPAADEFEQPPIAYSASRPENAVSRLQARIDAGEVTLACDGGLGYLRAVLDALAVPVSSQTLVFSKTSLQQQAIAPRTPRALYFNDDVYVGFVHGGEVVEVAVADAALGTVFYTLEQSPSDRPQFQRQTDDCLLCHGGPQTRGVPGHIVRSVYADRGGQPIFSAGSHRVDHTTPFHHRWGGWYVTGTHGDQPHLGNAFFRERPSGDGPADPGGLNVTDLGERFDTTGYPSRHSDLVALMVLAHQTFAHNVITKASFDARAALHRESELNRELGEPPGHRWPSTTTVLDGAAASLVECFLFGDEAPLRAPLEGTSGFAAEFAARGPVDGNGRSLRTFDLQTRLFRHPCSFLIYSDSFDALPAELQERFWRRMDAVLSAPEQDGKFRHLSAADRAAVRGILAATKAGAPPAWRAP